MRTLAARIKRELRKSALLIPYCAIYEEELRRFFSSELKNREESTFAHRALARVKSGGHQVVEMSVLRQAKPLRPFPGGTWPANVRIPRR
jgi:hypothetical protein